MAATGNTFMPKDLTESHVQRILLELRDMDRGLRSAVKHQQQAVEASLVEWRRSESSTKANNKKLVEERKPST
ncbi:hypothetical protein B0T10DRAFT_499401 [Thelonectria olida]|uniref:Uncharacterized protein n=1 Tax=Thelonectria olida TaxID=1576542 RepID=A0A9P9AIB5_9HYPO|nr:hypothetical protein B0T10DRAFT_499401 [Thelonectria olida]